jgi:hypothetical protein
MKLAGAAGTVTEGVVDEAAVGTLPLPPIAIISRQSRGSTASIFFVMGNPPWRAP